MKVQESKTQAPSKKERIYHAVLAKDDAAALEEFMKEPTVRKTDLKPVEQKTPQPQPVVHEPKPQVKKVEVVEEDEYIVVPVAMKQQPKQEQAAPTRPWNPPNSKKDSSNPMMRKKEEKKIANALREQLPSPTKSQGSKHSIPCVDTSALLNSEKGQTDDLVEQKWQEIIQQPLSYSEHDEAAVSNNSIPVSGEKYAAIHNFPCEEEKSWETEQEEVEELHTIKESSLEVSTQKKTSGPKKMCENISPFAQGIIKQLEEAFARKDFTRYTDLLWDADCEGLGNQIDLAWYER